MYCWYSDFWHLDIWIFVFGILIVVKLWNVERRTLVFCYCKFKSRADMQFFEYERKIECAISRKSFWVEDILLSIWGLRNLLFGRTSFSGMLKVVTSEPPFREQPYFDLLMILHDIWHAPFIKFHDPRKPLKLQQALCESSIYTSSGLVLVSKMQPKIMFVQAPSGTSIRHAWGFGEAGCHGGWEGAYEWNMSINKTIFSKQIINLLFLIHISRRNIIFPKQIIDFLGYFVFQNYIYIYIYIYIIIEQHTAASAAVAAAAPRSARSAAHTYLYINIDSHIYIYICIYIYIYYIKYITYIHMYTHIFIYIYICI